MPASHAHCIRPGGDGHGFEGFAGLKHAAFPREHGCHVALERQAGDVGAACGPKLDLYVDGEGGRDGQQQERERFHTRPARYASKIRPAIGAASAPPDRPWTITAMATCGAELGTNPANQAMISPAEVRAVPVFPATLAPEMPAF